MASLIRAFAWARTPLGPIDGWPDELRVSVDICLSSRLPMFVWWGPELIHLYNDACVPMLGERHPAALGRRAAEVWSDIWSVAGPQAEAVMTRGQAGSNDRLCLVVQRDGVPEERFFTWSYSPIRDRAGEVRGLLCACTDQTHHARAEASGDSLAAPQQAAATRDAEQRYRAVFESSRDGKIIYTMEGTVVDANPAACAMYGYTRGEIVGMHAPSTIHPDALPSFREFQRVAGSGRAFHCETVDRRRDGTEFPIEVVGTSLTLGGKPHLMSVVRDITQRKQTEEQLRRSHDTFYNLIQNNPFGVYVVDADFKLRQVSLGSQKVFANVRPLLGRDFNEVLRTVWVEPFASEALERFRHTLDTGEPYTAMRTIERRNDVPEVEAYDWRIERVALPDGRFGVVCYFYDLTERQRLEAALQESESRFRELADAMPQMVWVARPDGFHEYYNRRWYEFTGVPDGSTDGEGWNGMFHPDDQDRAWSIWRRSLASGEPYEIEYRLRHRSGEYRWTLGRALPIRDAGGAITKWFGTCTDINALKRLQQEHESLLERERSARAAAERASEAKSEFLATLSHELRTPLTPVLLTLSLMESHPRLPVELRDDVVNIRRNVELESRLISDLLDLTRITKGKLQLDKQHVDLHLIVRSAIDICQREASATLKVDLKADRHIVRGDSTRLQQVFWNLVNNAIKFTPAHGTITVRSFNAGEGLVRVEVSDTGVGIDPSVLPRLFSAFEQGEVRAERRHAGLGLGLAISRRLTEAHGGTITAFSGGSGRGSSFTVELPVVDAPAHAPNPQPPMPTLSGDQPRNVLLVEDHEPTLRVMERLLRHIGHQVTGVMSVASAVAAARQMPFDLIICDLGLPDGSGLDVMRVLGSQYAGRAIALTGYGMESDITASHAAGFAEHLTKPVHVAALHAAIQRVGTARSAV